MPNINAGTNTEGVLLKHVTTPSTPSAGYSHLYILTGDEPAIVGSAGSEIKLLLDDGSVPLAADLDVGDNNITNVGNIALDSISSDAGTSIAVTLGTDAGDDFNVGSGKLVVEGDTGFVGVGTAAPSNKLSIKSTGAGVAFDVDRTDGKFLKQFVTGAGSYLAFDSSGSLSIVKQARADIASTGNITNMMTINSNAEVVINGSTVLAQLTIDQSSATGAKPVLYLDQADVDQPIFQIETTIGTGNAVEAVGAKTLTTTHFVMLKLPGGLTRYFEVGTIA